MAQEFEIPGLKESIDQLGQFNDAIKKNVKDLLDLAVNAEKAVKEFSKVDGLKDYINLQKTAKTETDKVAEAKAKLEKLQGEEGKAIAAVNLQIQKAVQENKNFAKSNDESATALQKLNAQINESTLKAKELGAQMTLMALDGKKNTQEYKDLEKAFKDASTQSKLLNDSYRDISKTAGDNRALVGSYSDELKGHFEMINGSINSLKGNVASGNWSGAFSDARTVIEGFGGYLKKSTENAKEWGNEMKSGGGIVSNLKSTVTGAGESIVNFFKPAEQHSAKMTEGLERIAIGFKRNTTSIKETTEAQSVANTASKVANDTAESGTVFTNLWAGAQLLFAGATGVATGAVVTLGVALAAIGIGLIIAAVALLAEGLSNFRPLMNFLKDALAGVGAVVEMLSDKITQFVVNIKSVGDLISKIGDFIAHPIDSVNKLGKEMAETAKRGAELEAQTRKLTNAQKDYAIESKNVENQIKDLMLQARNRTTSEEDRVKILKQVQLLEEGMHNKKVAMWQSEMDLNLQKLKNEGKITDEEIKLLEKGDQAALASLKKKSNISSKEIDNFREIMTKKAEIDGEGITVREKSQNMIDSLSEKAQKKKEDGDKKAEEQAKKKLEAEKKLAEMTISTMKLTLDFQIASYEQQNHSLDENLAHVEVVSAMKSNIIEAEARKELIGIQKGSLEEKAILQKKSEEYQKIELEKNKALEDIRKKNIDFELELYDYRNQTLIKDGAKLSDLLVEQEKKRLDEEFKMHKEALDKKSGLDAEEVKAKLKNNQILTQAELAYLKELETLEDKKHKETLKIDKSLLDSKLKDNLTEEKEADKKFKILSKSAYQNSLNDLKNEKIRLQKDLELQKGNAEETAKLKEQLADNEIKTNELVQKSKQQGLNDSLSMFITVVGKESAVGKAAGIAQATINTYEGATKALTDYPAPYSYIVAGLTIAEGLMTVSKIAGISAFAEGTDYAPYTGKAIAHEYGPELHFDKNWNLKSDGGKGGAQLIDITQGDKIIPADISAVIRSTMFASYGMKENQSSKFDYAEMGKYFDKSASKIVAAVNSQKPQSTNVFISRDLRLRASFKGKIN